MTDGTSVIYSERKLNALGALNFNLVVVKNNFKS